MTSNVTAALNFAITQTGCTKHEAITALIKTAISAGIPVDQAYDIVLGPGSYQQLAGDIWEALQAA